MAISHTLTFADLLRRHRTMAGLTQEDLADRAGLSAKGISDLEAGRRRHPRRDTINLLADALKLSERERGVFEAAARARPEPGLHAIAVQRHPDVVGNRTMLVGRDQELEAIERHLEGDGPPLLVLAGEPGIGKTRLLREAKARAGAHGWIVLEDGCHRRSGQEPFAPLIDALASYLSVRSLAQQRLDLQGCAWLVRLLPELQGAATVDTLTWTPSAAQERRLMFSAARHFLANIAGSAGTLLLLDDLQWAGADALDLLASLLRGRAERPLRMIATYRDTEIRSRDALAVLLVDLAREGLATRTTLAPLTPDAADMLLVGLLSDLPEQSAIWRKRALQRAGGVPYFLLSLADGLHTDVRGSQGSVDGVPRDVGESVRQRVTAVSEAAKAALAAASVMGRQVQRSHLTALGMRLGYTEGTVIAALDEACHARLLTEQDSHRYVFTHDLVREVIAENFTSARRAFLHRQVAEVLEQAPGQPPVELLAYHYSQAGEADKAAMYLERAGDRAQAMYANSEAATYYEEAARWLDDLGRPAAAAQVREKLGAVLMHSARYDRALDELDRAAATYQEIGDAEGRRRATAHIGWVHVLRGTQHQGLARVRAILETDRNHLPTPGLASLYTTLAYLYFAAGDYEQQLAAAAQAAELARSAGDDRILLLAEARRGQALFMCGHPDECIAVLTTEVIPAAEAAGDYGSLWRALESVISARACQGDLDQQRHYIARGRAIAQRAGDPAAAAVMRYWSGHEAFASGDWKRARAEYSECEALLREVGPSLYASVAPFGLGIIALAEGNGEAAAHYLGEAVSIAERARDVGTLRPAQTALALRDLFAGHPDAARARLESLLVPPGETDPQITDALVHLAWASADLGELSRAEELVKRAISRAQSAQQRPTLITAVCAFARMLIHVDTRGHTIPPSGEAAGSEPSAEERWGEAEAAVEQALALSRAIKCPYSEAEVLYTYGLLLAKRGDHNQARARLEAARMLLSRLGERLYAEHVERALSSIASNAPSTDEPA